MAIAPALPVTGRLLSLDDAAARDPLVAGAKAAWLAEGRRAGLDVLPGVVVPARESQGALERAAATLEERGSGGARLVVAGLPLPAALVADLVSAGASLGDRLVVRSSSGLEAGGEWAGAFTSYVDVGARELPVAVRGCWASAFTVAALRRFEAAGRTPGSVPMAVLVQPLLNPDAGGAARIEDSVVRVIGAPGAPGAVLQGWEPGVTARVSADGAVSGAPAVATVGEATLRSVAAAAREAEERVGATAFEWAAVGGRVVLLQLGVAPRVRPPERPAALDSLRDPLAASLGRLIRRSRGVLGEALVLPWAVAAPDLVVALLDEGVPADAQATAAEPDRIAAELTAVVWGQSAGEAPAVLSYLRGPDPAAALRRIAALPRPDPGACRAGVAAVAGLLAAGPGPHPRSHASLGRVGVDRWEPFLAAVAMANAGPVRGVAAAGGLGAGRLAWVPDPRHAATFRPRDVLVAPRPLPQLAPLLWDAAGVVTLGGGAGAHLLESARALGIPAVTGVEGASMPSLPAPEPLCVAIDGWSGEIFVTPW